MLISKLRVMIWIGTSDSIFIHFIYTLCLTTKRSQSGGGGVKCNLQFSIFKLRITYLIYNTLFTFFILDLYFIRCASVHYLLIYPSVRECIQRLSS